MTENQSRYYAAELEERLALLSELPNDEYMTPRLIGQVAIITLVLPLLALVIGWVLL